MPLFPVDKLLDKTRRPLSRVSVDPPCFLLLRLASGFLRSFLAVLCKRDIKATSLLQQINESFDGDTPVDFLRRVRMTKEEEEEEVCSELL